MAGHRPVQPLFPVMVSCVFVLCHTKLYPRTPTFRPSQSYCSFSPAWETERKRKGAATPLKSLAMSIWLPVPWKEAPKRMGEGASGPLLANTGLQTKLGAAQPC
jgi:hypothetical protein